VVGRLAEGLLELLCPTRCAGCDLPGTLLCPECDRDLPRVEPVTACPRCGAPFGALVCTECWNSTWSFEAALALGSLEPPLSRAVVLHKDAGERRLAPLLGGLLAERVVREWPGWGEAVAFVPATRKAVRRRGFDHAEAIAGAVAAALEAPLVPALARTAALDQRALGREARAANAAGSFAAVAPVRGRVLLVDDVMTTGATLDAAAAALLEAGAEVVRCAVLARSW
jgi:predicted amidophosphoribosyltransferase